MQFDHGASGLGKSRNPPDSTTQRNGIVPGLDDPEILQSSLPSHLEGDNRIATDPERATPTTYRDALLPVPATCRVDTQVKTKCPALRH